MSQVELRQITGTDALDEAQLHGLAAMRTALLRELDATEPPATVGWAMTFLDQGNEVVGKRPIVALTEDGTVIGQSCLTLDLAGTNTHIAEVAGVEVHPAWRRRGVGRALLARMVALAEEEGRTSLVPWGLRSEATMAFWDSVGAPEVSIDRMSRVRLVDIDRALLARWRADCPARQRGYELHRWRGRCPDRLLPAFAAAQQAMNDAPTDDLEMEPEALDETWVRARERSWQRRGGEIWAIVALSPDGEPAGLTELIVMEHRPSYVMQQGTATMREHRNQGLGRWMKAEMLDDLLAGRPDAELIETGNAASNAAMLSINTELGFRPFVELTTRQVAVADIAARLR